MILPKLMKKYLLIFLMAALMPAAMVSCGSDKEEPQTPSTKPTPTPTPSTTTSTKVKLVQGGIHAASLSTQGDAYSYLVKCTADDPYVFSEKLPKDLKEDQVMLEFEYKCSGEVKEKFQVFYARNGAPSEASSAQYGGFVPGTSDYRKFTANINKFRKDGWGTTRDCLRFDPGDYAGIDFYIRNITLRSMTDEEKKQYEAEMEIENSKAAMAEHIGEYLKKDYPSKVTSVVVTQDKVTIKGTCGGSGTYVLADITPWQDVTEMKNFPYTVKTDGGSFSVTVDRTVNGREGIIYDRVFSKWAVVKVEGETQTLDSHARYADEVAPKSSPEKVPLRNKKGFGAGNIDLYFQDCGTMDVGSITSNILLHGIINGEGGDYVYGGVAYRLDAGYIAGLDALLNKADRLGLVVEAIILCSRGTIYEDPECTGGFYSMPNLTTAKAFNAYAAALEYMASRYNGQHYGCGRISHWIMHNEVDMGSEWTNMGEQPMNRYMDRYVKSMRICYNIARQYDQNSAILGSYTHNWTATDGGYSPKEMLEMNVDYSNAEGDFWWGVAYHPYPQDLTRPEFWKNDTRSTYSMDSPYVTFKNLEVIDKWIRMKENLYKGETKRLLFFSEQGTNSPSYSESDLTLQAAGGAWAWKKASALEGVDAIQWHNWADNKSEFGLRIGLRSFDDAGFANLTPKPVWYVWKAGGTDQEDAVFEPYKSVIGISDWSEIMHEF